MTELKLPIITVTDKLAFPGSIFDIAGRGEYFVGGATEALNTNNKVAVLFCFSEDNKTALKTGICGTIVSSYYVEGELNLSISVDCRAQLLTDPVEEQTYTYATFKLDDNNSFLTADQLNYFNNIRTKVLDYGMQIITNPNLILDMLNNDVHPKVICDTIAVNLRDVDINLYEFLSELDFTNRLVLLQNYVDTAVTNLSIEADIDKKVQEEMNKEQKEYFLRKKIRIIQEELGDIDKPSLEYDELREKIIAAGMTEKAEEQALKELRRYKSTISASPESSIIRNYIDTLLALPWQVRTTDNLDITAVKNKLDETHSGLVKPKERILDYLAVKLYSQKTPQTILCLDGPPGTGKTTIAKSIAEALGRKFVKQSLGGVKDEAEIRGHRRTYLGALPGRIINGIKEAGSKNPVFLLDEIDKLGADYKGDPSAALLEVLDPAQNEHFMDHYLELEFDLSEVMFICTANDWYQIPRPLRDRMERIELSSYTRLEKFNIAREHAIQKSLEKNGLEPEKFEITDSALKDLIQYYTLEAGARQLERCLDTVIRRSIKKIMADKLDKVVIDEAVLKEMLGKKIYDSTAVEKEDLVGVVNGLAYTDFGGDVLQIEAVAVQQKEDKDNKSTGSYTITGNLGDVMKESAEAAYNLIKANARTLKLTKEELNSELHIHCPEGATPKDGPSAGVTFVIAMLSAMQNKKVKHNIGMTGEITLRGRVLPIGGLKEKSIAAYTAGLDTIYIPKDNERDIEELPEEIKNNLQIKLISNIYELINEAFTV